MLTDPRLSDSFNITQNHETFIPEILYQFPARQGTPKDTRVWTYSLFSYQKSARRQFNLLIDNYNSRDTYRICGINYWKEYRISEITEKYLLIKDFLRKHGIVAYTIVEISEDDGGKPSNRLHYRFIVKSSKSKRHLQGIFNGACQEIGLQPEKDCRVYVDSEQLTDYDSFERAIKYLLKYGNEYLDQYYKDKVILFRPCTGINKNDQIGQWMFVNKDGSRANKTKRWKAIVAGWYPFKVKIKCWGTIQIGDESIKFGNGKELTLTFTPSSDR